jgi:hypothetical protein
MKGACGDAATAQRYKPEGYELTTLSPSCADFHEIWEPQIPGTLRVSSGLYRVCFTFILLTRPLGFIQFRGKECMQLFFHSNVLGFLVS